MNTTKMLKRIYETIALYRNWKRCTPFKPRYVELLVCSRCNLRCKMCNIWKLALEKHDLIKDELRTVSIINLYNELVQLGTSSICLSGGEPMLRDDIIILIKEAKKRGFFVELITNGSRISEFSSELVNSGLDTIIFSIDSPIPDVHDYIRGVKRSWETAIKGIKLVKNEKFRQDKSTPHILINYLVTNKNFEHIHKMNDMKFDIGYDSINYIPLILKTLRTEEFCLSEQHLEQLSELLDTDFNQHEIKSLCFAPWTMTTIDPFGNVYPCCYACAFQNLSDDLTHSFWGGSQGDYCFGNINNSRFTDIWGGQKYSEFRVKCKDYPSFQFCEWCTYGNPSLTLLFKNKIEFLKYGVKMFVQKRKYV